MEPDAALHAACRRLRWGNVAAGLVAAGQGAIMLLASNALALPVTASFLTADPPAAARARGLDRLLVRLAHRRRVGRAVSRRPAAVLVAGLVVLAGLSAG